MGGELRRWHPATLEVEPLGAVTEELGQVLSGDLPGAGARIPADQHGIKQLSCVAGWVAGFRAPQGDLQGGEVFPTPGGLRHRVAKRPFVLLEPDQCFGPVVFGAAAGAMHDFGGSFERLPGADLLTDQPHPQQGVSRR